MGIKTRFWNSVGDMAALVLRLRLLWLSLPLGMLVGLTLLVVWGCSIGLVNTIVDNGNTFDLVVSSVTVDVVLMYTNQAIMHQYGKYPHMHLFMHTCIYCVDFLLIINRLILIVTWFVKTWNNPTTKLFSTNHYKS